LEDVSEDIEEKMRRQREVTCMSVEIEIETGPSRVELEGVTRYLSVLIGIREGRLIS